MDRRPEARMRQAWEVVAPRYEAYELVLPGDPSFVCQASACRAHCCYAFSVSLGDAEVARLAATSGLRPSRFLESEHGKPLALPLLQPYLLGRKDGHCRLLAPDLRCSQYDGRPDACRLYPHFVLCLQPPAWRLAPATDRSGIRASLEALFSGSECAPYLPLLLRHRECPGFDGPPLHRGGWLDVFRNTSRLQHQPT